MSNANHVRHDPILLAAIRLMAGLAVAGFLYSLAILLDDAPAFNWNSTVLYMIWFGIAMQSLFSMEKGDEWGAYALLVATIGLTLYEFSQGTATVGGALTGLVVIVVVILYLREMPGNGE